MLFLRRLLAIVVLAGAVAALALASAPTAFAQSGGPTAFSIDTLNEGLPAPPEGLDRSTPQSALEAFLTATDRTDYASAAHVLDLASVDAAEQATRGPELARQLAVVLDRKIPLDFAGIPDRPDGMDTVGSNRQPMVGEPRQSINLGQLQLERWPVSVRLNRVVTEGSDPVWVFSRQTVEHVEPLHMRYGPTEFEKALPQALTASAFWGLEWWEVIAIPVILIGAALLGLLLYRAFKLAETNVPHEGLSKMIRRARLPVILFVLAAFMQTVVMKTFVFSAGADAMVSAMFWMLMIIAVVSAAARVLDTIIDQTSDRYLDTIDDPENTSAREWYTNLSAVKRVGVLAAVVLTVAFALSSFNIFSTFGMSLMVSAGVATAVFGLAAQAILGNIFASLQLAFAKPIRIGDAVYYKDHWAYVEKINYTYVQLRTWDQKRFIVPVKEFVSTAFENWTKSDPQLIKPVALRLDHGTDVEALRRAFRDIAANDPDWSEGADPKVQVIDHDEDGILVRFYCTADDPTSAWNLHCRVRERMLAVLRERDEPSDFPRTRLAYVSDTTEADAGASRTITHEIDEDTGEPKERTVREAAE